MKSRGFAASDGGGSALPDSSLPPLGPAQGDQASGWTVSGQMRGALGRGAGAALPSDTLALLIWSVLKCVPFERGRGDHAGALAKMGHLL